jgi:hypothetical protein
MPCTECARLTTQRELLEARYAKTLTLLSASVIGGIVSDFLKNRKAAYKEKIELERAAIELRQHQDQH